MSQTSWCYVDDCVEPVARWVPMRDVIVGVCLGHGAGAAALAAEFELRAAANSHAFAAAVRALRAPAYWPPATSVISRVVPAAPCPPLADA